MTTRRFLFLAYLVCIIVLGSSMNNADYTKRMVSMTGTVNDSSIEKISTAFASSPVFVDDFNSGLGYNETLWELESFGEGGVSWVAGEYLNISAKRHAYRTLTSKMAFDVGHEVSIRMRMIEAEAVVFVGWSNQTATTGWNYRFSNNSVHIQGAISTALLEVADPDPTIRHMKMLSEVDIGQWHTYRIVWNDTVAIAYVDGVRAGVIGAPTPSGPLTFKIAITEYRNQETEGWVAIDSVSISPHQSMVTENPPFIVVNSPGNGSRNLVGDDVDIALVGSNGTLYYSWNGESNTTSTHPFGITLPSSPGVHTLDLYCKDGYGYDSWTAEHYVFEVLDASLEIQAIFFPDSPSIDGLMSTGEWPTTSRTTLELFRPDGISLEVDVNLGYDNLFFYVAIDSPVPSGHDSRGAIILNGIPDGRFHGSAIGPVMTPYYTRGSPTAWEGYSELHFLNESADGTIGNYKIEPIPSGFLFGAAEVDAGVHYEFRVPLEHLDASPGDTIGISVMLFPSGMGVHALYYPMVVPWDNAARFSNVVLVPSPGLDGIIFIGILAGVGVIAAASFVLMRGRKTKQVTTGMDQDMLDRITELIASYEEISFERLARQASISEQEVEKAVKHMMADGSLRAEFDETSRTIRRK